MDFFLPGRLSWDDERAVSAEEGRGSAAERDSRPNWAALLLLAAVYFCSGKLGLKLAIVNASATAVWPPTGIALAAFLILGRRAWPAIFAGAFLVNLTTAGSVATSLGIAAGNTLEGLAGAFLVNRFAGGRAAMRRAKDVFRFVFFAGMVATAISATTGVLSLSLGGYAPWTRFRDIWLTWWLGDASGAVILTPLLLLWDEEPVQAWERRRLLELGFLLATLVLCGLAVFGGAPFTWAPMNHMTFMCLPVLLWAAFRFGGRETAFVCCLLSAMAVWGTLRGQGPFVSSSRNADFVFLQAFMATVTVTALAVSAVASEQMRSEAALMESHKTLEYEVRDRTAALLRTVEEMKGEVLRRTQAEKELELKAEALSRVNADLGQFAAIVSHELQEPLRKILTFGEILKTSKAGPESEERRYTERMEDAAKRMQRLVENILIFSRVTQRPLETTAVNLNEVAREVTADFKERLSEIHGTVEVGPLPTLRADPVQMKQLLTNLVSNAYKFHKKAEPLKVVLSCVGNRDGFVQIAIKDNGIGFEQKYADRLFEPFQRLNPRGAYEGSGIGLAICRRILVRHGGNISVKSAPGEGSVFTVTLPA